ncbi:RNA polymerase sigma factor [Cellulomonas cellasea]|uniref:RNA polymerase sigma-70 factor (ECF subfamily) n=1 Tax=Cellulomonas cellasea TaxID=43670 RepID=A0A7W4YC75_9CELL|nr:sigma-70 family RNA polymerase sigma factor [Cellulomonas cellasea]MBB2923422.1 RNA polymerase sigma-70 factor (ECF subfamily) [Cellulomonas cellasea]
MEAGSAVTDAGVGVRFTDLYTESYGRVLRFVERRAADRGEAEDLTAEVFRIAWSRAVEGTELSVPWLFVTARHVLANHYRGTARTLRLRQRVALALDPVTAGPRGVDGDDDPVRDAVLTTLAGLAPHHRDVLVLRYWDECSTPEVAAVLGCSTSSVWVRLHRARRAFQDAHDPTGGAR